MALTKNQLKMIPQLKTALTYSKVEHLISQYYEDELARQVQKIFQEMENRIIANLQEYYNPEVMFKAQVDLILEPIHELHKKYYETLIKYNIREFDKARASGKRIVERMVNFRRQGRILKPLNVTLKADLTQAITSTINKDKLFGTNPVTHENLETRTYQLSERTLARVDSDINNIITNGYDDGWGINKVGRDITDRFSQLKSWEAKRIARTEIHNSQCLGIIQGYDDIGVEYIQWSTSIDGRERDSHRELDGEIIRIGGVFSNGLRYPGDMNGSAAEVINCRCSALPFIMPDGYIAPVGMAQFRESDLVKTLDYWNQDAIIEQAMAEVNQIPDIQLSDEQIMEKLKEMDLEAKYDELNKILDSGSLQNWIKLTDKLDRINSQIARVTSNGGRISPGMQKAKDKLVKEMFAYEKAIFRKPQPIPDIDFTKFVLDNQEVGEAHSIVDTILEKKQIELQERIIMSVDEFTSIHSYGGVEHFRINGYIRQNQDWLDYVASAMDIGMTKEQAIRETEHIIKTMDSAIAKTPGLAQDTTMFRACDTFEGHLRVGDVSSFKGYGSCAFQEKSAKGFVDFDELGKPDRYLLKIYAPKGQKGIAMNAKNNGQRFTSYTHEHEYLLPKNQQFQVLEVDHVNKTATILLI